jgi:uncharacterized FlaG/YvyC family protein
MVVRYLASAYTTMKGEVEDLRRRERERENVYQEDKRMKEEGQRREEDLKKKVKQLEEEISKLKTLQIQKTDDEGISVDV